MSYLELKNVSFQYPNGYIAIENINMKFKRGEKVAIIGQNGAGKTTAVKTMNGLLLPSQGEVLIDSESTKNYTTAQIASKVGYVFQNPDDQIFQDTIYKEISFGLIKKNREKDEIDIKVHEVAELCNLCDVLNTHPYNLSYSKRKFITIAAIIAMDPEVIILDEPTAGQDRECTELLGEIIDHLVGQKKIVITITHDMEFVVKNFPRVIVMAEKRKHRDSNPKDIFGDEELIKYSNLKPPYIYRLAKLLGYRDVLTINDMTQEILKNYN